MVLLAVPQDTEKNPHLNSSEEIQMLGKNKYRIEEAACLDAIHAMTRYV